MQECIDWHIYSYPWNIIDERMQLLYPVACTCRVNKFFRLCLFKALYMLMQSAHAMNDELCIYIPLYIIETRMHVYMI